MKELQNDKVYIYQSNRVVGKEISMKYMNSRVELLTIQQTVFLQFPRICYILHDTEAKDVLRLPLHQYGPQLVIKTVVGHIPKRWASTDGL